MKKMFSLILLMAFTACTHQREKAELEQTLAHLQCEAPLRKDPFQNFTEASAQNTEYFGKKALAYTYIAGNYTAEVLWDVSAGVVLFAALCVPVIAAQVAAKGNTSGTPGCIPAGKSTKALFAPPLGRRSVQKTQSWRCPNYEPLVETLQKVVTCYENKNTKENFHKALQTLDNLESSPSFYDCLTDLQKLTLQNHRFSLQKRLADSEEL
jgi:hypothetical protein